MMVQVHIGETFNKLQQLGQAPKKIKGNDTQRRKILQKWCAEQKLTPVFESNGELLY